MGWCLTVVHGYAGSSACSALKGRQIAASQIGLPTGGAVVRSAKLEAGAGGGFCKVLGRIRPVDPAADPIRFEVNLPETWNGKGLQYGGGAFDGWLHETDGLRSTAMGDRRQAPPLARGFATFGSDSGHHHHYLLLPDILNALSAKFALNDEERHNFASDGLKKTHDVAVALMKARYGSGPRRMYFIGGSTGGREAMKVVDRWPEDYDGVLAAYAAWNQVESDLQFIHVSQAMYSRDGWLPAAKTKLLRDAVLNACDAADGLKDGIVSNPAGCRFDPQTLACRTGAGGKECLTPGQMRTVAAFTEPQVSDFKVANGMDREPGYNMLRGADLVGSMGLFHHAFHPPIPGLNSFYYLVGDGVLRFFLTKDTHFNALTFDTRTGGTLGEPVGPDGGKWVAGIRQQSAEDDASKADLSAFEGRGGKLLLVHGTADAVIPTDASVLLYRRIVAAMGQERADGFLRLYLVPGFGHGRGVFDAGFDTIGVLDAWADGGGAPVGLVVADQNKGATRTRPLCAWPTWPKFQGGDANKSASFACEGATD